MASKSVDKQKRDDWLRILKSTLGEKSYYEFKDLLADCKRVSSQSEAPASNVQVLGKRLWSIFNDETRRGMLRQCYKHVSAALTRTSAVLLHKPYARPILLAQFIPRNLKHLVSSSSSRGEEGRQLDAWSARAGAPRNDGASRNSGSSTIPPGTAVSHKLAVTPASATSTANLTSRDLDFLRELEAGAQPPAACGAGRDPRFSGQPPSGSEHMAAALAEHVAAVRHDRGNCGLMSCEKAWDEQVSSGVPTACVRGPGGALFSRSGSAAGGPSAKPDERGIGWHPQGQPQGQLQGQPQGAGRSVGACGIDKDLMRDILGSARPVRRAGSEPTNYGTAGYGGQPRVRRAGSEPTNYGTASYGGQPRVRRAGSEPTNSLDPNPRDDTAPVRAAPAMRQLRVASFA